MAIAWAYAQKRTIARTARYCLLILLCAGASFAQTASNRAPIQQFLVRNTYLKLGDKALKKALEYRLLTYTNIRTTSFFGMSVRLHEAVHEPLRCVEKAIKKNCVDEYHPQALSGWRSHNTFKKKSDAKYQEYSNHIFGLALDIDPKLNPCCGCVKDWAKSERCRVGAQTKGDDETPLGRYEIPHCWIEQFKDHGFYWLGDDRRLRDTMHFEYLAAPGSVSCAD